MSLNNKNLLIIIASLFIFIACATGVIYSVNSQLDNKEDITTTHKQLRSSMYNQKYANYYDNLVKTGSATDLTSSVPSNSSIYKNRNLVESADGMIKAIKSLDKIAQSFNNGFTQNSVNEFNNTINSIYAYYANLKKQTEWLYTGSDANFIPMDKGNLSSRFSDAKILSLALREFSINDVALFTVGSNITEEESKQIKSFLGFGYTRNLLEGVMHGLDDDEVREALCIAQQYRGLNPAAIAAAAEKFCYVKAGWIGAGDYAFNVDGFEKYLKTLNKVVTALKNSSKAISLNSNEYAVYSHYKVYKDAELKQSNALAYWKNVNDSVVKYQNYMNNFVSQLIRNNYYVIAGDLANFNKGMTSYQNEIEDNLTKALNSY